MQDAASVPTDQFIELLARLPVGLDLDSLALETKAIQRRRELVAARAGSRAGRIFVAPNRRLGIAVEYRRAQQSGRPLPTETGDRLPRGIGRAAAGGQG